MTYLVTVYSYTSILPKITLNDETFKTKTKPYSLQVSLKSELIACNSA